MSNPGILFPRTNRTLPGKIVFAILRGAFKINSRPKPSFFWWVVRNNVYTGFLMSKPGILFPRTNRTLLGKIVIAVMLGCV